MSRAGLYRKASSLTQIYRITQISAQDYFTFSPTLFLLLLCARVLACVRLIKAGKMDIQASKFMVCSRLQESCRESLPELEKNRFMGIYGDSGCFLIFRGLRYR